MKEKKFQNLCPIKEGFALQCYWTYMQTIGEVRGRYPDKIYGGKNYITRIRQTEASILVRVIYGEFVNGVMT